jgi:hypothetical protein
MHLIFLAPAPWQASPSSPTPPPRPNVHHLILLPLSPTIHNQVPVITRSGNAAMVRPYPHPLPVLKLRNFKATLEPIILHLPRHDPMLLADPLDPPSICYAGEVGPWKGLFSGEGPPGHEDPPPVVELAVVDGLAAEGESAGVDEVFGCFVRAAAGVDCICMRTT